MVPRPDAVTNDPALPGRILLSDYLGQQACWPTAKAGGGWKRPAFGESCGLAGCDAGWQLRTFNRT
ncbi:MAG: hypothetical protein HY735_30790 [Verrucomicrobia bacterium]|nr:hypothetical protein [Verrucomicrobiota bacterium]